MVPGADVTALLPQIRVPTLLLAPARSSFTPLHEQVKVPTRFRVPRWP